MSENQPIVIIEDGQLQGTVKIDWLGGKYYSFQGIPYAKPPLGNLRFKAPQPVEPWTGVRDASKEGSDCYSRHVMTRQSVGSEDCLFLNVYTPKLSSDNEKPKPVMVWIHGGGFTGGSGNTEFYGPDYLVAEDVVIVTINYRLGLLGFAYFSDLSLEVPGNAGLKDQVQALKWIQKNILKFGGDPDNVTLFGVSAGAASVHYLILSPLAKGLFHKAIVQSGAAIGGWCRGRPTAPRVAKVLRHDNVNEADIIKILTECPVERILEIQQMIPEVMEDEEGEVYGIAIESPSDKSAFLTRDPLDILASGSYSHVPLMIGYTSREGMFLELMQKDVSNDSKWNIDYKNIIPHSLQIPMGSEFPEDCVEKIKKFYFGTEIPSPENINQLYLIYTDVYFTIDINNAVRSHTKTSTCPTYYYRVSLETDLNIFKKIIKMKSPGACHGDELGYLFKGIGDSEVRPGTQEYVSLRRFTRLWTTFAKYGNPNPIEKDDLINITWPPAENNKLNYLEIGENLTVGVDPDAERVAFWDEISNLYSFKNKQ